MIIIFGPVSNINDLLPLEYPPSDLPVMTSKDHLILFVKTSFLADEQAVPLLDGFPFKTVMIEADNNVFTDKLAEYPDSRSYGGRSKKLSESVCVLTNCGIYRIEGKNILVLPFGQARENASNKPLYLRHYKLRAACRKLLEKEDRTVDFVISQIIPFSVARKYHMMGRFDYNTLMAERFNEKYVFDKWFFTGFYHDDALMKKYRNVTRFIHVIE